MITIVSGFQRCGSSLMLQMLAAAGVRVFHDEGMGYPSFETHHTTTRAGDPSWLLPLNGWALKWLEPKHAMPPEIPHEIRVLWMTRDHKEQARSAVKFLRAVSGLRLPGGARHQFEASYDRDEPEALEAWKSRGLVQTIHFEHLITHPNQTAMAVSLFLGVPLDIAAMAREVRVRTPKCLPGLLELELVAAAGEQ